MTARPLGRLVLAATVMVASACGSSAPDPAVVERTCGEARNACVEACGGGGNYVPEPCSTACEAGRNACRESAADHCRIFRDACVGGCQTPRCTAACEVGVATCPGA